ncbi:hypothetical protein TNCV_4792001 [Trichonephila clavipes]|nr:hypothetical protein TNCV_4792001 [Trichonephila clavipes]
MGFHAFFPLTRNENRLARKDFPSETEQNTENTSRAEVKLGKSFQPFLPVPSVPLPRIDSSMDFPSSQLPPGGATAHKFLHRSINRQVANRVAENDANLALSPTFRYVFIESPS